MNWSNIFWILLYCGVSNIDQSLLQLSILGLCIYYYQTSLSRYFLKKIPYEWLLIALEGQEQPGGVNDTSSFARGTRCNCSTEVVLVFDK
jgi:hypothetical protein